MNIFFKFRKCPHNSSCSWVVQHSDKDKEVEDDSEGGEDAGEDGDEEGVAGAEDKREDLFL